MLENVHNEIENEEQSIGHIDKQAEFSCSPTSQSETGKGNRLRWSVAENKAIAEAFRINIRQKRNCSALQMRQAMKKCPVLSSRSEAKLRSKISNIIKQKDRMFYRVTKMSK